MLVRFHSPADADIIMFGAVAQELLALMGFSGRIPSAVQAEDLPAVREKLISGLAAAPPPPHEDDSEEGRERARNFVPLKTRAQPLLKMIDAAIRKDTYVMWEQTR
ncbi:MAG TPA: DUF1840 domain-containing protein [Gammaproteobacteria bacterium]|mgnify:CR=1 FL=1|nr:DUF1840 domain-containing protein [Gammaproteobacteria bacterium]